MNRLAELLHPPSECLAAMLPSKDRRRGGIWCCPHARKIIGKGKSKPDCLCRKALEATRQALAAREGAHE